MRISQAIPNIIAGIVPSDDIACRNAQPTTTIMTKPNNELTISLAAILAPLKF